MTAKTDFTDDEWKQVSEGPTSAGLLVITADKGGMFKETFSMAKAYAEARGQHGESELLDAIVSEKPKVDRPKAHSPEELRDLLIQDIRNAIGLVQGRATEPELDEYRQFIRSLAERVAAAHSEHGQQISEKERAALEEIENALRDQPF